MSKPVIHEARLVSDIGYGFLGILVSLDKGSYFTEIQAELLSLIHSPVTAPGKGLLTATVEKEEEAPPKGVMTEEEPPNGVSPVVRLL